MQIYSETLVPLTWVLPISTDLSETHQPEETRWTKKGPGVKHQVKMKTENRIQTSKLPANHTVHWFALIFLQHIAEINTR